MPIERNNSVQTVKFDLLINRLFLFANFNVKKIQNKNKEFQQFCLYT